MGVRVKIWSNHRIYCNVKNICRVEHLKETKNVGMRGKAYQDD